MAANRNTQHGAPNGRKDDCEQGGHGRPQAVWSPAQGYERPEADFLERIQRHREEGTTEENAGHPAGNFLPPYPIFRTPKPSQSQKPSTRASRVNPCQSPNPAAQHRCHCLRLPTSRRSWIILVHHGFIYRFYFNKVPVYTISFT